MSARLPVVSGAALIKALERQGWEVARQRGSHIRLKHPQRARPLTVPLHKEIKRKTLAGIMKDAGITADELRNLL